MLLSIIKKKKLDQFLSHLHRIIESRERRDVVLLFAGEAMRLLSFLLQLMSSYLRKGKTIKLWSRLFYRPQLKMFTASTNRASNCARAVAALLDEWQMMNRLWGVLDMWMAARELMTQISRRGSTGVSTGESIKPVEVAIQASQILCLTSFHICEATSFLSTKGIANLSAKAQDKLSLLAIRSWTAFTVVEIGRLSLDRFHTTHGKEKLGADEYRWRKDMLQNLAWLSVSLHWSLRDGLMPEGLVSPLAVFATWSLVKDAWRESAEPNDKDTC